MEHDINNLDFNDIYVLKDVKRFKAPDFRLPSDGSYSEHQTRSMPIRVETGHTGSHGEQRSSHTTTTRTVSQHHSDTGGTLGGSDVDRQRRMMEEELRQRSLQQHQQQQHSQSSTHTTSHGGTSPGWRQAAVPHESGGGGTTRTVVVHRQEPGAGAVMPQWSNAAGAQTKATSSGTYDDPEGHKVHYTKEVYTSSDPGKEFSMLTEEEKKVMEQPLQPGVISRHVTTKYYKKSTYTSSTTTGTTQAGHAISAPSMSSKPVMIEPARPGYVSPGVSQF